MTHTIKLCLGLLITFALAPIDAVHGQPAPTPVPGVVAPTPAPANLWTFLCPNAEQKAACKTCWCNSALGQMVSGMAGPMSMMSGGLVQNRCLKHSVEMNLKKPADDSEGAAARIMADEEAAKERRKAVRYLGTVDCNYWPEAIAALKNALRKDRNECVRFEAALALRNGCCCNVEIVEALKITVMGVDHDGAPPERSDRVRAAAADALSLCVLPVAEPAEKIDETKKPAITDARPIPNMTDYYKKVAQLPREQVMASARNVLVNLQKTQSGIPITAPAAAGPTAAAPMVAAPTAAAPVAAAPSVPAINTAPRSTSLSDIMSNAFSPTALPSPGPRQPFFSGLTKSLTGRQDYAPGATSVPMPISVPQNLPETQPLPPMSGGIPGIVVTQPMRP